jgi:hypothetical protein
MISQNLNDPAFRNFPATTLADHALQFPFHRAQAAQAFLDTVQVLACDGVHLFTRLFGLIENDSNWRISSRLKPSSRL